jgi:hypothetical protein
MKILLGLLLSALSMGICFAGKSAPHKAAIKQVTTKKVVIKAGKTYTIESVRQSQGKNLVVNPRGANLVVTNCKQAGKRVSLMYYKQVFCLNKKPVTIKNNSPRSARIYITEYPAKSVKVVTKKKAPASARAFK